MSIPTERQTLRGSPVVAAPGKLFLVGEYAVLDGASAVVAAVSRHAVGQFIAGGVPESDVVAEAVFAARAGLGERAAALPPGSVLVDTSAFLSGTGEGKLGLGSSSATAVASVAAVLELAGLSVSTHKDLCFSLAEQAHRSAQGGLGSGADVAAAVHGGLIHYRRSGNTIPQIERLRPPPQLQVVVFAEGTSARTVEMLRPVKELAGRDPEGYAAVLAPLRAEADRFVKALAAQNVAVMLEAARAYGEGLAALGERAGIPIVTPRFELAAELAVNLGGAAKPSGAGAGDCGVALFGDAQAARNFASRARALGLRVIDDINLDLGGVHRRRPRM